MGRGVSGQQQAEERVQECEGLGSEVGEASGGGVEGGSRAGLWALDQTEGTSSLRPGEAEQSDLAHGTMVSLDREGPVPGERSVVEPVSSSARRTSARPNRDRK